MASLIVINNLKSFNEIKSKYTFDNCDLNPIEIKGDRFILGLEVLEDKNFIDFFNDFKDYTIEKIAKDDFIKYSKINYEKLF